MYVNNIGDTARLFALANLATADAFITCWNDKKRYFFWRPITAIQEGNNDGNPRTIGDPTWEPLGFTPPYPDHTSGANNITGAMTGRLRSSLGLTTNLLIDEYQSTGHREPPHISGAFRTQPRM